MGDILSEEGAPYVNTNEFCPSDRQENYLPDRHYVPACNRKFGERTIEILESYGAHVGAPAERGP